MTGAAPRATARGRRLIAGLLLALALVLGTLGAAAACLRHSVVDSQRFGERVTAALAGPQAREVIGRQVAEQIVARVPPTLLVRPVIEGAVQTVLTLPTFRGILSAAVADLHATVLRGDSTTVTLRLVDVVLLVKAQLAATAPRAAALIPDDLTTTLVRVSTGDLTPRAARWFDRLRGLAVAAPALTLALLAGFVTAARNRRTAFFACGAALAGMGAQLLIGVQVARLVVLRNVPEGDARTIAVALWTSLTSPVRPVALGLAAAGGALTAVVFLASSAVRPRQALTWLGRAVVPPESRPARAVWCLAALVVGTLVMLDAPAVLRFVLTGAGGALVLVALTEAVRLIAPGPTEMPTRAARRRPRRVSRSWWRPAAAAAVAVAVVAGATLLVLRSGAGASPTGADDPRCNGSVLLCDRRLDEVVVPATHNSNASAADGYLFANQPRGILPQLDAGYRGLLIDVYFGLPVPGRSVVLTDRAPLTAQQRAEQVAELGQAAVAAAEQIHARASQAGAVRSTYLCHGFCELGATPLEPELAKIRDWLQAHPREVLVLFVQDEIPAEPIVRAFQSSGLDRFAAALDLGKPLPTLGQMVASNRRLVVMAENQAGVAPWYLDGFAFTQETPYSARSEADFSCRPNRGRADSPLLLVNNFVTPASVRAAARANSREVLQPRLTECQRQRDRLPNLVAVDFYDTGDVLGVVRTANGLTGAP